VHVFDTGFLGDVEMAKMHCMHLQISDERNFNLKRVRWFISSS